MRVTSACSLGFFISDPITCNRFVTIQDKCQSFCSNNASPNLFSRLIVGVVIKGITRVCAIAFNVFAGLGKLALCAIKLAYSVPAKLWNSFPNYQKTGKEGLVFLGFSGFYLVDIFISFKNISHTYPEDILEKVECVFAGFLYGKDPLFLALLASGKDLNISWILANNAKKFDAYLQKNPSLYNPCKKTILKKF